MTDQTPHTPEMVTDEKDENDAKEAVRRERPDLAKLRGNADIDEDALEKGKEVLGRVKPY